MYIIKMEALRVKTVLREAQHLQEEVSSLS